MSADNGGSAFPCVNPAYDGNWDNRPVIDGMTLRDYFAAKAMPLSYEFWMRDFYHPDGQDADCRNSEPRTDFDTDMRELIADTAYEMAEAMLKRRQS